MKKLLGFLVVAAIAAAAVAFYFNNSGKAATPQYRTEKVDRGPMKDKVGATGRMQPTEKEIVGSDVVVGRVVEIYPGTDIGAEVSEGQPLLRLDDEMARAKLKVAESDRQAAKADLKRAEAARDTSQVAKRQAEATHDYAEKEFKRIKELGQASPKDLDAISAKVDAAKEGIAVAEAQIKTADAGFVAAQSRVLAAEAGVDRDQKALDMTLIKAPVGGTIIDRQVIKGQVISPQTAPMLFVIVPDLTKMQVEAQVGESDILKVKEGMPVQFTVDAAADSGEVFHGKVSKIAQIPIPTQTRIAQLGDAGSNLAGPVYYRVWIDVVQNADNHKADEQEPDKEKGDKPAKKKPSPTLKPGLNASVDIILRQESNVLRVPAPALNFQPNDVTEAEQAKIADGVKRGLKPIWVLAGGARRLVLVQTGATEANRTEVTVEGDLKEGTDVIIEGPPPEKPGGIFESKTGIRL